MHWQGISSSDQTDWDPNHDGNKSFHPNRFKIINLHKATSPFRWCGSGAEAAAVMTKTGDAETRLPGSSCVVWQRCGEQWWYGILFQLNGVSCHCCLQHSCFLYAWFVLSLPFAAFMFSTCLICAVTATGSIHVIYVLDLCCHCHWQHSCFLPAWFVLSLPPFMFSMCLICAVTAAVQLLHQWHGTVR